MDELKTPTTDEEVIAKITELTRDQLLRVSAIGMYTSGRALGMSVEKSYQDVLMALVGPKLRRDIFGHETH